MKVQHLLLSALLTTSLSGLAPVAAASESAGQEHSDYPNRPIRMVVPFTPGATNDTFARATGKLLSDALGQPVIIENRAGAGAVIGTDYVAKAPADGYTILQVPANHSINTSINNKLPYHPTKDFTFLTLAATSPFLMVVNPEFPAKSVKEFIALAKASPGKYTYASAGTGGNAHLMGEMLKSMAGIDLLHVPYKGAAPAMADLMGGQVDMFLMAYAGGPETIKSGKMRAIGVTSKERWSGMPNIPTFAESGVPGYEANAWWGFAVPAGTPPAIAKKLEVTLNEIVRSDTMRKQFEPLGFNMLGTTQEEFARFVEADTEKWANIIRESKIATE